MIEIDLFNSLLKIQIDWEYAIESVEKLDTSAEKENRSPVKGKAAIIILGEYGAIAHRSSFPPEDTKLAVVISPPSIWFCPSQDGLHGVFFEEYKDSKYGSGIQFTKLDLFDYTNIDARLDAWNFYSQMLIAHNSGSNRN